MAKNVGRREGHAGLHLAGPHRITFSPKSVLMVLDGELGALRVRNKAIPVKAVEESLAAGPFTLTFGSRTVHGEVLHHATKPLKPGGSHTVILFKLV